MEAKLLAPAEGWWPSATIWGPFGLPEGEIWAKMTIIMSFAPLSLETDLTTEDESSQDEVIFIIYDLILNIIIRCCLHVGAHYASPIFFYFGFASSNLDYSWQKKIPYNFFQAFEAGSQTKEGVLSK